MLPARMLALGGFHHRHFFGGILVLVLILVVIALGVALIARVIRAPRRSPGAEPPLGRFVPPSPAVDPVLSELRLRYARGEISREEYLRRAADLGYPAESGAGPPPWPSATPPDGHPSAPGGYPSPPD